MTFKFVPEIGAHVKLRLWDHYQYLMQKYCEIPGPVIDGLVMWAWFRVDDIMKSANSEDMVRITHMNANKPLRQYEAPLSWIDPPLGWKPVYDIYCKDREQADNVVNDWFNRGITCWASHALDSLGSAFTPLEKETNKEQHPGHWKFGNNAIETIPADMCRKRFNVYVLTQYEPKLPPVSDKAARRKAVKELRANPQNHVYIQNGMYGFVDRYYMVEHTETIFTHEE